VFYEVAFLTHLQKERRLSQHTLVAYTNDLAQFLSYCQDTYSLTSVSEVRHLHIRAWIVVQMQAGQSARSINRRLSCLKTYFRFLKKRGLIEATVEDDATVMTGLSDDDLADLLDAA